MPKRPLTPEEKKLWKLITRNDKPLRPEPDEEEDDEPAPKAVPPPAPVIRKYKPVAARDTKPKKPEAPRALGEYKSIDRNTAERFRKGNYPIDATLDLHGMTAAKAHEALLRFIAAHHKRENRCLLVVTGKGKTGEGVLRKALPGWLMHEDLAPLILAFDTAKVKHGGSGAYYVLLRRKR